MKNVTAFVTELITPVVNENECLLWDVEFVREGARKILRVTIDKEDGVTLDDCERVHRAIDPILDEADPIEEAYYLEVSSPGVERSLTKPWHIRSYVGEKIDVSLFSAIDGKKKFSGILEAFDEETGEMTVDGIKFGMDKAAKLNAHFDFDD